MSDESNTQRKQPYGSMDDDAIQIQSWTRSSESNSGGTIGNGASGSSHQPSGVNRSTSDETIHLTVEDETYKQTERLQPHPPSQRVVAMKWISTFVLASFLLAFVTQSKISAIAISENMQRLTSEKDNVQAACRMFVILFLIVLIPNGVNFLRGIWGGLFRKDIPWPGKRSFFVGFFICAIETFGTCIFVMKIPSLTQPYMVILLSNCVFIVPVGVALYKAMFKTSTQSTNESDNTTQSTNESNNTTQSTNESNSTTKSTKKSYITRPIFFGISFLLELTGIGLTVTLWIWSKHSTDLENIWYPIVGTLCLSIAWVPEIQSFLLQHATEEEARYTPTWKMVIYMSFIKIVLTFVFSFTLLRFAIFDSSVDATAVIEHFKSGWYGWEGFETYYFIANGCSSLLGYVIGFIACTTCMQKGAYAMPLFLATPLAAVLFSAYESCVRILHPGDTSNMCLLEGRTDVWLLVGACSCLVFAQFFSFGYLIIISRPLIKQDEAQLFWFPTYNPVLLEQWLLLSRRNDESQKDPVELAKRSRVYICTTMYRETDNEMRQLMESIKLITQSKTERHFESHIFFDGAIEDGKSSDFVLQLVELVLEIFVLRLKDITKDETPYGRTLTCKLKGNNGMNFRIHLKDNAKVKNKKRWSQIMYMSYVLDYLLKHDNAKDNTYILTTDGDVKFTHDAVEALLDLMTRDPSVGAVCARTHPLGSGPMVWYQVFEYAIGHWFQKATEHVIGSVLCAPGCFSVYRCKALEDVLAEYSTDVKNAFDFLIKDMGEDRWLCTLMVKKGWRIEYCAASENSTQCPEEFEELYMQRRRWVASTLANMMLLIKEWDIVAQFNHRVTVFFLLYHAVLLFATLTGPSSVILVVSGGLVYGWGIDTIFSLVTQVLVCLLFVLVCLLGSSKAQLNFAKFLTFVYAVVMSSVVVGVAVEVATDFSSWDSLVPLKTNTTTTTTENPKIISADIRFSTITIYLGIMSSIFLIAGILHLKEGIYLIHGIWYLLCLPSGYLILMLYSICNITDRSWGTREAQTISVQSSDYSWKDTMKRFYQNVCFCFLKDSTKDHGQSSQNGGVTNNDRESYRSISTSIDSSVFSILNNNDHQQNTEDELKRIEIKNAIDNEVTDNLEPEEVDFWEERIGLCLQPSSSAFHIKDQLKWKQRLGDLRNQWLMVFAVSNTLWLVLISTLAYNGQLLNVFGSNVVGLLVLVLFTFVLIIQFLAMVVHRIGTVLHFLGRAPYRVNDSHQMGLASIECGEGEAPQDVEEANSEREPLIRKETSDCVIVV